MAEFTRYRGWIVIEPYVAETNLFVFVNMLFLDHARALYTAVLTARPIVALAEVTTREQRTDFFVVDAFDLKLDPVLNIWKSVAADG